MNNPWRLYQPFLDALRFENSKPNDKEIIGDLKQIIRLTQRENVPGVDTVAGWEPTAVKNRLPEIERIATALLDRLK